MSKKIDRLEIKEEICKAAELYREKLVGKSFLYVFEGRYIEVIYKAANFKHLTGVESTLTAKRFYSNAANHKLSADQIEFSSRHPFSTCKKKLKHISDIATLAGTESFMLKEIHTNSRSFKFGTTDLNFSLLLDHEYDKDGKAKSGIYIAESLRDEDCFSKSEDSYEITHILSKDNDVPKYTDLLFMDKRYTIKDIPEELITMIDDSLLN